MLLKEFEPKLFTIIKGGYPKGQLLPDLTAGLITGIVALPLAIAFAVASGVKPEQGLYTAIIAGLIISVFSGSKVQIGGPTGAFIVVVYAIVEKYGFDGLAVATLMAGVMLIVIGLARLGNAIKYIPYPVTVGFTGGIALVIAVTQLRDFFGFNIAKMPGEFFDKMHAYGSHVHTFNPWAFGLGVLSIVIILVFKKYFPRIPGSLVAILVATGLVAWLKLPVETIGNRFGSVPSSLPVPAFPHINLELIRTMFPSAVTIALLAGIESLLSAVVADGMTGGRHRSNAELVAQGLANLASPIFGGIPATGAIARTATNIKNGGRTPLAGIVHAITLLLILLFFGKWAALIPMTALAAILLVVAWNMSEAGLFIRIMRGSTKSDAVVLLTTFILTVVVDLTAAIEVGVVMAVFLFMRRMETVSGAKLFTLGEREYDEDHDDFALKNFKVPPKVEVFEINGPFFFGAATKFKDSLAQIETAPRVLILRMRNVPALDATGLRALEDIVSSMHKRHTAVVISGLNKQPAEVMDKSGLADRIGRNNLFKNISAALGYAGLLVESNKFSEK